jgi:hypothetical protein
MKWSKAFSLLLSALALSIWAVPSLAIEPIPRQDGFSGRILVGVSYFNFESNEIAEIAGSEVSEKRTNSLGDEPDSKSSALPAINFDLRYTLGSSQTQFFLANTLLDMLKLDSFVELGVRQQFADRSILAVSAVFSGLVEVYEDPYVVGADRESTTRDVTGARVVYDKIMGSGLAIELMFRNIDIDDERSGTLGGLGLTPGEISLLDREGTELSLGAQYSFPVGEGRMLTPSFTFINSDLDGGAMKNNRYQVEVKYVNDTREFAYGLNLLFALASYDKSNPVFNKEQEDTIFGAVAFGSYKNLFDVPGLALIGRVGAQVKDADIDFLNSQAILAGLNLQYRF